MYDRETGSLWSQLAGEAVHGPMKGTPLEVVPAIQTTWKHWREMHPETRVVVFPAEKGKPYRYRNWRPGTPEPKKGLKHSDTSSLGLGLVKGGEAIYLPFHVLRKTKTPLELTVGGQLVRVFFERKAPTAWAEDADGNLLPAVLAYKFGWLDFHPESRIFGR